MSVIASIWSLCPNFKRKVVSARLQPEEQNPIHSALIFINHEDNEVRLRMQTWTRDHKQEHDNRLTDFRSITAVCLTSERNQTTIHLTQTDLDPKLQLNVKNTASAAQQEVDMRDSCEQKPNGQKQKSPDQAATTWEMFYLIRPKTQANNWALKDAWWLFFPVVDFVLSLPKTQTN